jgi:hypothetical protein
VLLDEGAAYLGCFSVGLFGHGRRLILMLNGHQSAYLVNYFVSRLPRAMNDGMCWRDAATVLFVASKKNGGWPLFGCWCWSGMGLLVLLVGCVGCFYLAAMWLTGPRPIV